MGSKASPDLPWKTRLFIGAYCFGVDVSRRSDGTVNRRLMSFFDPKFSPSSASSDHTIDDSRNLWFRLFLPSATVPANAKLPLIFYIHGGGFAFSGPDSKPYNDFCRRLATELPAAVVSVNYRLSPEHRFPSQYDDAFDALKFIDTADLPPEVDRSRCFIAGDSAGGNIAHHVTVRYEMAGFEKLKIAGLIMIQPFFGGEERTEAELRLTKVPLVNLERTDWMWKAFLPEGADRNHAAAKVFGSGGGSEVVDLAAVDFPATLVFVGGFDPLQDWQRMYYEWVKKSGKEVKLVEYPNAVHGFYGLPELPESDLLIVEVRDFIQN